VSRGRAGAWRNERRPRGPSVIRPACLSLHIHEPRGMRGWGRSPGRVGAVADGQVAQQHADGRHHQGVRQLAFGVGERRARYREDQIPRTSKGWRNGERLDGRRWCHPRAFPWEVQPQTSRSKAPESSPKPRLRVDVVAQVALAGSRRQDGRVGQRGAGGAGAGAGGGAFGSIMGCALQTQVRRAFAMRWLTHPSMESGKPQPPPAPALTHGGDNGRAAQNKRDATQRTERRAPPHHWSPNTAPARMALMVALKSTALPGAP
jgi:hypothetical protein